MIERFFVIAAIILSILLMPPQQSGGCALSSGLDIPADLAVAQAGSRCLEISAGTFPIGTPTAGAWLNVTADGMEIRGAGMEKTVLRITQPLTLTADMAVIRLFGVGQHVHDLTIDLGHGHSGAGNLFRNTGGRFAAGVVSDVPALIDGNTFEDVLKVGAQTIGINATAGGSVVTNNRLTGTAGSGGTIQINAPSIVTGNYLDNPGTYQPFFGDTRGSIIANNLVR